MKTLTKISAFIVLFLFGSGAFAQSCDLTIYDTDNTGGAYYDLAVQLWNVNTTPATLINTEYKYNVYVPQGGQMVTVPLGYQVAPDYARLKFHIYAQNKSTLKYGNGWSVQYFDSGDYYYNSPPVSLSIQ